MDTRFETRYGNRAGKDEWLTPRYIISLLGPFDLDPCAPVVRPWDTADNHYTVEDDGLSKEWAGLVWCNPPYGSKTYDWLHKCAEHGNCLALTFSRTETKRFHSEVWNKATALFFFEGRLAFHHVSGERAKYSAGAPSVLIAYGDSAAERLINFAKYDRGKLIVLKRIESGAIPRNAGGEHEK